MFEDLSVFDELHGWRRAMQNYLDRELELDLPEDKIALEPCRKGLTFLGYRVFPGRRELRRRNKLKFRRRLRRQKEALRNNEISYSEIKHSIESWKGHAQYSDTEELKVKYVGAL